MPSADLALSLAKQAVFQLLRALSGWLAVFVLVAAVSVVRYRDLDYPLSFGWLRFARLLGICLPFFPVLVFVILGMRSSTPDLVASIRWSIRAAAIVFGIAPAIYGLVAVKAFLDRDDPWRYLPGGPPIGLVDFARRHPHLRARDWGWGYALYDSDGNRVTFAVGELERSTLNWEKCVDDPILVRIGGPPPLPRSNCILHIVILQPDYSALTDEELDRDVEPPNRRIVKYVYHVPLIRIGEVNKHFRGWAESKGGGSVLADIDSGGKKWRIDMITGRREVSQVEIVYIEAAGSRQP